MSGMPRKAKTRGKRFLTTEPLHRHAYQPVRIVGHEQRDIQEVAVQLQIFQREPHPQLDLLREQFLEFAELLPPTLVSALTSIGNISFSL